ncbi:hypothetical protein H3U93_03575 [Bifidobacterium sp. W8115]|nr:hypothetical protein [Bifidobacterium sp. W8112]MBI0124645.1 hypothetical protein [Bifidobacterium apousia]
MNSEFALGDAAFYQNGTWAWTDPQNAEMDADKVGMLPVYMGLPNEQKQRLATGGHAVRVLEQVGRFREHQGCQEVPQLDDRFRAGQEYHSPGYGFHHSLQDFQ